MWNRQREADEAREKLAPRRRGRRSRPTAIRRRCEDACRAAPVDRRCEAPADAAERITAMSIFASIRVAARRRSAGRLSVHRRLRAASASSCSGSGRRSAGSARLPRPGAPISSATRARVTPVREGLVVSPADGTRQPDHDRARRRPSSASASEPLPRISIFMSVFDCHVNRSAGAGRIETIVYKPGKFLNADLDKASEDNERNGFVIATRRRHASASCRSPAWSRAASSASCARAQTSAPASASA